MNPMNPPVGLNRNGILGTLLLGCKAGLIYGLLGILGILRCSLKSTCVMTVGKVRPVY
jgi:hypothetical protein